MTEDRADVAGAMRVGDAERDEAARELGEHYAVGRLTADEFDDRLSRAYAARTGADLGAVLGDLPRPVATSPPVRRRRHLPVRTLAAAALLAVGMGTGVGVGHAIGGPDGPPGPGDFGHRVSVGHQHPPWMHPGGPRP